MTVRRVIAALMLLLTIAVCPAARASEPGTQADEPGISGAGVFLKRPGGVPIEIGFDENGRLDTAVPPGGELYFAIDNASIASHLSGYSAYIRFSSGEEATEGSPVIRYVELFDSAGTSLGYRYAAQLRFSQGSYQEPPQVTAYIRVGTRNIRQNEFRFTAVVQDEPLDAEIGEVHCPPDIGLFEFAHEFSYTRLIFAEGEEEYGRLFVRTGRQRPLDISYSRQVDERIAAAFPHGDFAAISFAAAPVLDNMAELYLSGPQGHFLYELTPGGLLSPSYRYDAAEGRFELRTRRLGNYIISSVMLPRDIFAAAKPNPLTGALQGHLAARG